MKTFTFGIKEIIIVILVILSGYLYFFDKYTQETETIVRTYTIPGDTQYVKVEVPSKPIVQKVKEIEIQNQLDTIFIDRPVDSLEIMKKYFAYYHRIDTISSNECELIIEDTITQNKIIYENIRIKNIRPIQIVSNTTNINVKNRKLYLGGMINTGNFSSAKSIGIGIAAGIQDKKDNMFTYGYDFTNKTHQVGVLFKIKL